jgi:hypothetical protein
MTVTSSRLLMNFSLRHLYYTKKKLRYLLIHHFFYDFLYVTKAAFSNLSVDNNLGL